MHTTQFSSPFSRDALQQAAVRAGAEPVIIREWPAELESTNSRLADILASGEHLPDFAVVGTDHQVGGRGRLGRTWTVPAAAALTFSTPVAIPAHADAAALGWVPVVTGLAVTQSLADLGVRAQVKWPNDVLTREGRKLCGILCQLVPLPDGGRVLVIGCGINVALTTEDLPVETASSVLIEGGTPDREALLAALLSRLPGLVAQVLAEGTEFARSAAADQVRSAMVTLGARVRVHLPGDTSFTGTAVDLDAEANLLVRDDARGAGAAPVRVSAGDVVHVRPA